MQIQPLDILATDGINFVGFFYKPLFAIFVGFIDREKSGSGLQSMLLVCFLTSNSLLATFFIMSFLCRMFAPCKHRNLCQRCFGVVNVVILQAGGYVHKSRVCGKYKTCMSDKGIMLLLFFV